MISLDAVSQRRTRGQANELLEGLSDDVEGATVVFVADDNYAASPSFVDGLVKGILIDRRASLLEVVGADEATCSVFTFSAERHGALDRLHCAD